VADSPRRQRVGRKRRPILLGYCPKCGRDVEVDFCDHCGIYVQPSPHDKKVRALLREKEAR